MFEGGMAERSWMTRPRSVCRIRHHVGVSAQGDQRLQGDLRKSDQRRCQEIEVVCSFPFNSRSQDADANVHCHCSWIQRHEHVGQSRGHFGTSFLKDHENLFLSQTGTLFTILVGFFAKQGVREDRLGALFMLRNPTNS